MFGVRYSLILLLVNFILSYGLLVSHVRGVRRASLNPFRPLKCSDSNEFDKSTPKEITTPSSTGGGGSDISTSIANLAKSILGAGVLSLPSGVALCSDSIEALAPTIGLLSFMGVASAYSFSSIGKACQLHQVSTFAEAYAKSFNVTSGYALSSAITFKTFFGCLAYSIIIGDSFSSIAKSIGAPAFFTQRNNVILGMTSFIIFPLCLLKRLDMLKYTSILGVGGVFYCALFVALRYFDRSYQIGGTFFPLIEASLRPTFNQMSGSLYQNPEVFRLIAMISSAYVAHYNAPKFWKELKNPTRPRYNFVVTSAFFLSFLIYVAVSVTGFLTFGGSASGFILNNYASSDILATIARIAIGVGIIFGYPLTFSPLRDGIFELFNIPIEKRNKFFVPITISLLGVLTSLALILKNVGFVVSFGGALIGTMLIYTLPALMNLRNMKTFNLKPKKGGFHLETIANYGMGLMGVVVAIIGVYLNIQSLKLGGGGGGGGH